MSVADQSASAARVARRLPLAVRMSPQFLNRLGAHVQTAGGTGNEIAGLLFGRPEEELVDVQAFKSFRAIDPQTDSSPRSTYQDELFYDLMLASRTDPEVSGFDLIGWYSVRAAGGLHQSDIEFHERHFRRPSDVALILRWEREHYLLELYTRSADGVLSAEEHRSGALRLSMATAVAGSVEIAMKASISDDFYLRAYEVGKSLDRVERREQWRSTVQSTKNMALSVLWPKRRRARTNGPSELLQPEETSADAVIRRRFVTAPAEQAGVTAAPARETHTESSPPERPDAAIVRRTASDIHNGSPVSPPITLQRIYTDEPPGLPAVIPHQKERRVPWLSSAIVFVLVAAATFGVVLLYALPAGTGVPEFLRALLPSTGLRLRAEGQGDRVLLSWNRLNPVVRSAREGILRIVDGSQRREVRLDPGQVANGSVLYRPASGDVTFLLEVHGDRGATIADSMRVLDGETSPPASASPKTTADASARTLPRLAVQLPGVSVNSPVEQASLPDLKSQTARDTPRATPSSLAALTALIPPAASGGSTSMSTTGASPSRPVHPDSNSESAAPLLKAPDTVSTLLSPPALQDSFSPAGSDSKLASWEMPALPKPVPNDKANETHAARATPAQPLTATDLTARQAPARTPSTGTIPTLYVAPVPIRQILPDLRALAAGIAAQVQEIEVEVTVDKNGHVLDAHISREGGKVKPTLARAAVAAARQWTFRPATLHGVPVTSDHSIVFQFHSGPR